MYTDITSELQTNSAGANLHVDQQKVGVRRKVMVK